MLYRPGLVGRLPCPQDWYVPSAPPIVSDDFLTGAIPAGWTFTRGSSATDSTWQDNPNQQTYNALANDVPLINQWGLKIEPSSTNMFLNSDAPVTQSITFAINNVICVWMVGPGSLTTSNGTGTFTNHGAVTNGAYRTLTCTAPGTMTITVTGTVYRVQVERLSGGYPTSYMPTTGVVTTRQACRLSKNYLGGQLNRLNGTYWIELLRDGAWNNDRIMMAGVGSFTQDNETDTIHYNSTVGLASYEVFSPGTTLAQRVDVASPLFLPQRIDRIAAAYDPQRMTICANYGSVVAASCPVRPATLLAVTLLCGGAGGTSNGYIRGFRYWNTTMSDQELHECTGAGYYGGRPVFDLDMTVANSLRMWTNDTASGQTGTTTDASFDQPAGTAITNFAYNQHRVTTRGTMFDTNRNNYLVSNPAPAASGTSGNLPVQTMMFSMRGTGSMTFNAGTVQVSGTPFPLTISQGVVKTITVTVTGTVTWTTTGSVDYAQIEQVGTPTFEWAIAPTSFVRTTGAAQSRVFGGMSLPIGPWWNTQGTYYFELYIVAALATTYVISVDNDAGTDREQLFAVNSASNHSTYGYNTISGGGSYNYGRIDPDASQQPFPTLQWVKVAMSYSTDRKRQLCINGLLGFYGSSNDAPASLVRPAATKFRVGRTASNQGPPSMIVRRLRYYDYAIFDDALKTLTT